MATVLYDIVFSDIVLKPAKTIFYKDDLLGWFICYVYVFIFLFSYVFPAQWQMCPMKICICLNCRGLSLHLVFQKFYIRFFHMKVFSHHFPNIINPNNWIVSIILWYETKDLGRRLFLTASASLYLSLYSFTKEIQIQHRHWVT